MFILFENSYLNYMLLIYFNIVISLYTISILSNDI